MTRSIWALGLIFVSLATVRIHPIYADEPHPLPAPELLAVGPNALKVEVARHSIDLDVGTHRTIHLDVPIKASRSADSGIVNAVHKDDMTIELSAVKSGATKIEVQTPNNGTIFLNVTAREPVDPTAELISFEIRLLEINADNATIKKTLDRLVSPKSAGTSVVIDGRMFSTIVDEKLVKAKLEATGAKIIAESSLVAASGRPASFHRGGEIPIMVPQADGNVIVEFREFGERIDLVAHVLNQEKLTLEVRPSVTTLKKTKFGELEIPGLVSSTADMAMEMDINKVAIVAMIDEDTENADNQNCLIAAIQPRRPGLK